MVPVHRYCPSLVRESVLRHGRLNMEPSEQLHAQLLELKMRKVLSWTLAVAVPKPHATPLHSLAEHRVFEPPLRTKIIRIFAEGVLVAVNDIWTCSHFRPFGDQHIVDEDSAL